jgi:hypothetical protein
VTFTYATVSTWSGGGQATITVSPWKPNLEFLVDYTGKGTAVLDSWHGDVSCHRRLSACSPFTPLFPLTFLSRDAPLARVAPCAWRRSSVRTARCSRCAPPRGVRLRSSTTSNRRPVAPPRSRSLAAPPLGRPLHRSRARLPTRALAQVRARSLLIPAPAVSPSSTPASRRSSRHPSASAPP